MISSLNYVRVAILCIVQCVPYNYNLITYTQALTRAPTHTHAHTKQTHTQSKAKSLAAAWRSHRPSEAVGCLGMNQAL